VTRTLRAVLISTIFFSASFLEAAQKPILISGYDDVLRQAENTGLIRSGLRLFSKDQSFTGMPELYTVLTRDETAPKFFLVSATSHWFASRIENFLSVETFPPSEKYLRNWITEWSIDHFKIAAINAILQRNPERTFIAIFDESEASLRLADSLNSRFSTKFQAVYLRQINEQATPTSAILFWTAFDIAINEFAAGRLSAEDVLRVADAILAESHVENIFPPYSRCPTNDEVCRPGTALSALCNKVQTHVRTLCLARAK
jgi:hypothetical protein